MPSSSPSSTSSAGGSAGGGALLAVVLYVGLLYTHTRAAFGALVAGLVVLALAQRRLAPVVYAAVSVAVAALFLVAYPSVGPSTSYTPQELEFLRANAEREPEARAPSRLPPTSRRRRATGGTFVTGSGPS